MEALRVPKRQAEVEIVLPGGARSRVFLFLGEAAESHEGPERVSDLLNGQADFIPALDVESGGMTFLNRTRLALARVSAEVEADHDFDESIPFEAEVEVSLADGTALAGKVSYMLPEGRARLGDYLNGGGPFFRVLQAESVVLVNKRHVARVAVRAG